MSWPSTDFEVEIQSELDFLRYFYKEVEFAAGASSEFIYDLIKDEYCREGNEIPEDYK
jgi:hypothetical protein